MFTFCLSKWTKPFLSPVLIKYNYNFHGIKSKPCLVMHLNARSVDGDKPPLIGNCVYRKLCSIV